MMMVSFGEKSIFLMRSVSFLLIFQVSITCNSVFVVRAASSSRRAKSSPPKAPVALPSEQIIIGRRTINNVEPIFGFDSARNIRSNRKKNSSKSDHQEDTILTKFGIVRHFNVEMKENRKVEDSTTNIPKPSRKQATNIGDRSLAEALVNQYSTPDSPNFDSLEQPDIEEIHCNGTSFSATIVLPKSFVIAPEFNDPIEVGSIGGSRSSAASAVSAACTIKQVNYRLYPTYKIVASNFGLCGVTKSWLDDSSKAQHQQLPFALAIAAPPPREPAPPKFGGHARQDRLHSHHRHRHGDRETADAATIEAADETGEETGSGQVFLLNIRFPVIKSLRTNEDTYATLVCSPESRNNRYEGAVSDDFRGIITGGDGASGGNIGQISYNETDDDEDEQERGDAYSAIGDSSSDKDGSSDDTQNNEPDIIYGSSQEQGMNNESASSVRPTAIQPKQLRQQLLTQKQRRRQQQRVVEERPFEAEDLKDGTDDPIVEESRRRQALSESTGSQDAAVRPPAPLAARKINLDSSPPSLMPTTLEQIQPVATATTTETSQNGSSRKLINTTATVAPAAAETLASVRTLMVTTRQPPVTTTTISPPETERMLAGGILQISSRDVKDVSSIVASQPQLGRQTGTNRPDRSVIRADATSAAGVGRQSAASAWFSDESWPRQTLAEQQQQSASLTNESLQRDRHVTKFVNGASRVQLVAATTLPSITSPTANRRRREGELLEAQQKLAAPPMLKSSIAPIGSDNQLGLVVATLFCSLLIILLVVTVIIGNLFAIL